MCVQGTNLLPQLIFKQFFIAAIAGLEITSMNITEVNVSYSLLLSVKKGDEKFTNWHLDYGDNSTFSTSGTNRLNISHIYVQSKNFTVIVSVSNLVSNISSSFEVGLLFCLFLLNMDLLC